MTELEHYRDDDGTIHLRLARPYLGALVSISLGFIILTILGVAFFGAPSDIRIPAVLIGVLLAAVCGVVLYGVWNRAIVIDGTRVAYSNGITGPKGWIDTSDVACVAFRAMGNPAVRPQFGVVLFAPDGGKAGMSNAMARWAIDKDDRRALAAYETDQGRLRSLFLPVSELGAERRAALHPFLVSSLAPTVGRRVDEMLSAAPD